MQALWDIAASAQGVTNTASPQACQARSALSLLALVAATRPTTVLEHLSTLLLARSLPRLPIFRIFPLNKRLKQACVTLRMFISRWLRLTLVADTGVFGRWNTDLHVCWLSAFQVGFGATVSDGMMIRHACVALRCLSQLPPESRCSSSCFPFPYFLLHLPPPANSFSSPMEMHGCVLSVHMCAVLICAAVSDSDCGEQDGGSDGPGYPCHGGCGAAAAMPSS